MNSANRRFLELVLIVSFCLVGGCRPPLLPDLTGVIECPAQASPGEELGNRIKVVLKNIEQTPAKDFFVDLVLSSDTTIPVEFATYSPNFSEDVLLEGGSESVTSIDPGASLDLPLYGTNKIPDDTPSGDYYLGLVVDPGKTVTESNEANNVGLCQIQITECASIADITDCQIIEASGGTVGFARLRLAWTYGTGEKPDRLLITVYRFQGGEWDNIMPSDEPFEVPSPSITTVADVTIFRLFSGDYRIVFTAYYSCDREKEFIFERQLGSVSQQLR